MAKLTIPPVGILRLKDVDFEITSAKLKVTNDEDGNPRWDLDVRTKAKEVDEREFTPHLSGEGVLMQKGDMVVGRRYRVDDAYDDDRDEYNFVMYVLEHEDAYANRIELVEIDGSRTRFEWKGRCNVGWNSKYGDGVPFALNAWVDVRAAKAKPEAKAKPAPKAKAKPAPKAKAKPAPKAKAKPAPKAKPATARDPR